MICVFRDNASPSISYLIKSEPQERPPAQDYIDMEDNHDSSRQPTSEPHGPNFFKGATNTQVVDGRFTAVGGSVFHQSAQPPTRPAPRPRQQQNPSFFEDSSRTLVTGGDFMAVGGDVHGSPPSKHFPQHQSLAG